MVILKLPMRNFKKTSERTRHVRRRVRASSTGSFPQSIIGDFVSSWLLGHRINPAGTGQTHSGSVISPHSAGIQGWGDGTLL